MPDRNPATTIDQAQDELIGMAGLAGASVHKAVQALNERRADLAREVLAAEHTICARQARLEAGCLLDLSLTNPAGRHLRRLGAVLLISVDLVETAADAAGVARIATRPGLEPAPAAVAESLLRLEQAAVRMLQDSLDALVRGEVELAVRVGEDQASFLQESFEACAAATAAIGQGEDRSPAMQAAWLLVAAQRLEQIGRTAARVADRVRYALTGRPGTDAPSDALTG